MAGSISPAAAAAAAVATTWKSLLSTALEANAHLKHSSFFQLATVGRNGRPANRTVVFRGFQENSDRIQIHTDGRSIKIEEIKNCPFGEICWYFTDSWEQFRINGMIDVIDGADTDPVKLQQRERVWFTSSLKSRVQYVGPIPSLPVISEDEGKGYQLDPSAGPVDAFTLLVLDPEQVDYLNLKRNERLIFRTQFADDGCKVWMSEKVNP